MRLNRYLALAGLASRRACEAIILAGRVKINGHFVKNLATDVRENDRVEVDGRPIKASQHHYWALNKPRGYHCTACDPEGRHTIFELLPPDLPRMFYVGRLDADSEGLLIVTNDGNLAQKLTHPSHHVEKEYEVTLDRPFDEADMPRLMKGMRFEEGKARVESARVLARQRLSVVLKQGIKRQIRRMFYAIGYEVEQLRRVRIGGFLLGKLPVGSCRPLTSSEIAKLSVSMTKRQAASGPGEGKSEETTKGKGNSSGPAQRERPRKKSAPRGHRPASRPASDSRRRRRD